MGLKTKQRNLVVSEGILGIQTNSKYIGWSFGNAPAEASQTEFDACKVKVRLNVDDLEPVAQAAEEMEKFHYWRSGPERDEVFYQRNFLAGSKLRLDVRGLVAGDLHMRVNERFLKRIKFRFNNLHSPGYLMNDLVCVRLLEEGYAPLHCSAFTFGTEDSAVLVIAPPDTGKTLTTMRSVFDAGAEFLSEDLAITDGETLYACPWTSTFRYYDDLSMSWQSKLRMKLIKVFPLAEFMPTPDEDRTIDNYIEADRIKQKAKISHVAILARRKGGLVHLDKNEARRMVFGLNRYEFNYMKSPIMVAYSYFNPSIDLDAMVVEEKRILGNVIDNAKCMMVQNEDPTKFSEMILGNL